jgi:hypothetical protein
VNLARRFHRDVAGQTNRSGDLLGTRTAWLVWGAPKLAVIAGLFLPGVRFWLWAPAFFIAGAACLYNARSCGRFHCRFTGPLFLVCSIMTGAVESGRLAMSPFWIPAAAAAGLVLSYAAERRFGKYGDCES